MMKDRIREVTLLLMVVITVTGCRMAKQSTNLQTHVQEETQENVSEAVAAGHALQQTAQVMQQLQQQQTAKLMMQEGIPAQEAIVNIPIRDLLDLPEGAGYTSRDGRASVNIQKQGDHIIATGHCDSLLRKCLFYEREIYRQQNETDSLKRIISDMQSLQVQNKMTDRTEHATVQSIKEKPPATWYKWLLAGFITGIFISTPLKRLTNKVLTLLKSLYGKE